MSMHYACWTAEERSSMKKKPGVRISVYSVRATPYHRAMHTTEWAPIGCGHTFALKVKDAACAGCFYQNTQEGV